MSEQAYQDPLHVRLRRMAEHAPERVEAEEFGHLEDGRKRTMGWRLIPIRPLIEEAADELERLTKRIPITDVNELEKLSAEASKGLLQFEEGSSYALPSGEYVQPCCINEDGETVFDEMYPADGRFVMALWNAYRSGALVPAGSDAWRTDMENAPRDEPFLAWWDWCDYGDGVMEAHFDKAWFKANGDLATLGDQLGQPTPYSPTYWKPITPPNATPSPDPRDAEIARLKEVERRSVIEPDEVEALVEFFSRTMGRTNLSQSFYDAQAMANLNRCSLIVDRLSTALNGGRDA